jgi:hypothetical protein
VDRFVVRVWLPDRPGALGLVASRIGAVRGEIHGIEILEQGAGRAIDELVVELPDAGLIDLLVGEVNAVDGVDVEEVRRAPVSWRDPRYDALETAASLMGAVTPDEVLKLLVDHATLDLEAAWAAVVGGPATTVVAHMGGAPDRAWLVAFVEGSRSSALVAAGDWGPDDIAWAPLVDAGLDLVLGRHGRPLRARERHQLMALSRLADLRWAQLSDVRREAAPLAARPLR